jgi:hypothetical protein
MQIRQNEMHQLRNSKLFDEITSLIVPGSMNISFFRQMQNW